MVKRWEKDFKVSGWTSECKSIGKLLAHLSRKSRSEASRELYCSILDNFCLFAAEKKEKPFLSPDEIVSLSKEDAEGLVQEFCDLKVDSRRYAIMQIQVLKTFFKVNGFKGDRELDLDIYSLSGFG